MDKETTWLIDGNSFIQDIQRYSGTAVVSNTEIIWAKSLMARTSAKKAELIALTKALEFGKNKKFNIYTDSQHAFTTTYIHRAI